MYEVSFIFDRIISVLIARKMIVSNIFGIICAVSKIIILKSMKFYM